MVIAGHVAGVAGFYEALGGSSLYRVGLVGLAPAWRVDGGKIVSLTA